MVENKEPFVPPDDLRQRAEAKAREDEGRIPAELSAAAARQLLHELRVHQLELELQNEELRRAQAELEATRVRYFDLYDLAPVGYLTLDASGLIIEANLRASELLGVPRGLLARTPLPKYILPDDADSYYLQLRQLVPGAVPQGCELRLNRAEGVPFWGRLDLTAVRGPDDALVYRVILHDISERKRLQQELVRTERLRALGELSAGICHNLNNLLTGVLLPAEILLARAGDPQQTAHLAAMIVAAGNRATDLVHRLHLSVRGGKATGLGPLDLNEAIAEVVRLTQPHWLDEPEARGLRVRVATTLAPVPPITGTRSELHDLLTNLLFNAVEAMPQGGVITIETTPGDGCVWLRFSDTGTGMDEATRQRVFEPFFTTRTEVGSGLGLSTLHNSVTQWGGSVDVESAPGEGSAFILRLPVWPEPVVSPPSPGRRRDSRPGKVMVVDDSEAVGAVLRKVLGHHHEVAVFTDPTEALASFAAGRYDVGIFDLGMGGLTGDELARQVRQLDPALGCILLTGWELDRDDPRRAHFDFTLQKPLRGLHTLEDAVAQAILLHDQRGGAPARAEEGSA